MSLSSILTVVALAAAVSLSSSALAAEKGEKNLAHDVFFRLKQRTPENREKLVEACEKLLTGHDGTVYFAVGVVAEEFNREVNDLDYDVALHIYFKDKAAHDKYQDSERHTKFVNDYKDLWDKVRVYDSWVRGGGSGSTAKKVSAKP